jgi:hypothetical protein
MTRVAKLELHFVGDEFPELYKTVFRLPQLNSEIVGVRGHIPAPGITPFKWTTSLHALSLFFVKARLIDLEGNALAPVLLGGNLSPASSIDYSLYRVGALWIGDLFGFDANGKCFLKRVLRILNTRQKRLGPVQIVLNASVLPASAISIYLEGVHLDGRADIHRLCQRLEISWHPWRTGSNRQRRRTTKSELITSSAA